MSTNLLCAPSAASLVLPEILTYAQVAGAIARQTESAVLANRAVLDLIQLDLEVHPIDAALARKAADLAGTLKLRGADAFYVALAHQIGETGPYRVPLGSTASSI